GPLERVCALAGVAETPQPIHTAPAIIAMVARTLTDFPLFIALRPFRSCRSDLFLLPSPSGLLPVSSSSLRVRSRQGRASVRGAVSDGLTVTFRCSSA